MNPKNNCLIKRLAKADDPGKFLESAVTAGTQKDFAELHLCSQIKQKHNQTILDHISKVLTCLGEKNEITVAAALFHDIGKVKTKRCINNRITFYEHPLYSAMIAKKYLKKWKYGESFIDSVSRIIETHMFDIHTNLNKKNIRNFIAKVGMNNIKNWFVLRRADALSYNNIKESDILDGESYIQKYINGFEKTIYTNMTNMNKKESFNSKDFDIFGSNSG